MTRAPYQPQPGTVAYRAIAHLQTLPADTELTSAELSDALDVERNGLGACLFSAVHHGAIKTRKRAGTRIVLFSLGNGTPPPSPADEDAEDPAPPPLVQFDTSAWTAMAPRSVFDLAAGSAASSGDEKPEVEEPPAPAPKPTNVLGWTPAPPTSAIEEINIDPVGEEELADAIAASVPAAALSAPMVQPAVEQPQAPAAAEMFHRPTLAELRPVKPGPASFTPEPKEAGAQPFACALWSDGRLQLVRGDTTLALLAVEETRALLHYLDRVTSQEDRP